MQCKCTGLESVRVDDADVVDILGYHVERMAWPDGDVVFRRMADVLLTDGRIVVRGRVEVSAMKAVPA